MSSEATSKVENASATSEHGLFLRSAVIDLLRVLLSRCRRFGLVKPGACHRSLVLKVAVCSTWCLLSTAELNVDKFTASVVHTLRLQLSGRDNQGVTTCEHALLGSLSASLTLDCEVSNHARLSVFPAFLALRLRNRLRLRGRPWRSEVARRKVRLFLRSSVIVCIVLLQRRSLVESLLELRFALTAHRCLG